VPVSSYFSLLTSEQVTKQFPVMTQAISQIRAKGLQTAVLTNNFHLSSGESFLPLDRKQFDVVSTRCWVCWRGSEFISSKGCLLAVSRKWVSTHISARIGIRCNKLKIVFYFWPFLLSVYLSVYLSIYLSIFPSIHLFLKSEFLCVAMTALELTL
jgi:hypothetical protein